MANCFFVMDSNFNDSDVAANIFVSSENYNFKVSNTERAKRRAKVWRSTSVATEQTITWDLGLPTTVESFIMVGRRNAPIQVTPSGTYKLQANPTDAWGSPSYDQTLTYDGEAMVDLSVAGLTTAFRYWRLSITDTTNSNGYIELSAIHLGNHISPTTGRVQIPLNSAMTDRSESRFTEGGQLIGLSRETSQIFNVKWFNLKKAEVEEFEQFFAEVGTSRPFFVSMDTDAVWSTASNRRAKYVRFKTPPAYTLQKPDLFSMNMSFQEEI